MEPSVGDHPKSNMLIENTRVTLPPTGAGAFASTVSCPSAP